VAEGEQMMRAGGIVTEKGQAYVQTADEILQAEP